MCSASGIDVSYEGPAKIITLEREELQKIKYVVVVEIHDTVFALKLIEKEDLELLFLEIAVKKQVSDIIYDFIDKRSYVNDWRWQWKIRIASTI